MHAGRPLALPWKWLLPVLSLLAGGAARAEQYHYLIIFGAQLDATQPRYTHSWAVYARATGTGPCVENYCLESFAISWLPQTLEMRYFALPEPGVNLDLYQTLQWAQNLKLRVSVWGPYLVDKEIWDRAVQQFALLNSRTVRYKMIDAFYNSERASNCIHAISTVEGGYRLRIISPSYGETASFYITHRYRRWICNPHQVHEWVYDRLGLHAYPTVHRAWNEHPRSGIFWGGLRNLLGIPDPEPTY